VLVRGGLQAVVVALVHGGLVAHAWFQAGSNLLRGSVQAIGVSLVRYSKQTWCSYVVGSMLVGIWFQAGLALDGGLSVRRSTTWIEA
jgi:hypothetical protein